MMLATPLMNYSGKLKPLMSSQFWYILEELSMSAFFLSFLIVSWYFTSRDMNTVVSIGMIFLVSVSTCFISYIAALPFYLFVERPFKNFLNLILFPKGIKHKDNDDDGSEEEELEGEREDQGPTGADEMKANGRPISKCIMNA